MGASGDRALLERKGCPGVDPSRPNRVRVVVLLGPTNALASVGLVVKQLGSNRRSNAFRASSGYSSGLCSRGSIELGFLVGVAQPVELQFCKLEVRGSSPLASSAPASRFELACKTNRCAQDDRSLALEGCPSGQWERAVNPPAYAYGGSNPPPSTRTGSETISESSRKARQHAGYLANWVWSWRARWDSAIGRVLAAGVAQLVERQPSKLNVVGSNPISRSQQPGWRTRSIGQKNWPRRNWIAREPELPAHLAQ